MSRTSKVIIFLVTLFGCIGLTGVVTTGLAEGNNSAGLGAMAVTIFVGPVIGLIVASILVRQIGNQSIGRVDTRSGKSGRTMTAYTSNKIAQWFMLVMASAVFGVASIMPSFLFNYFGYGFNDNYQPKDMPTFFWNGWRIELEVVLGVICAIAGAILIGHIMVVKERWLWLGAVIGGLVGLWWAVSDVSGSSNGVVAIPLIIATAYMLEVSIRRKSLG